MIGELILSIIGAGLVIIALFAIVTIFAYVAWVLWKEEFSSK